MTIENEPNYRKGNMQMARLRILAGLTIAALVAFACGGTAGTGATAAPSTAATASPTPDPIRVTLIGSFTGQNADLGNWMWNGVKLAVDRKSELFLDGTVLDFYDGLEKRGFTFNNPNAVTGCGCGSSFRTADDSGQARSCAH